MAAFSEHTLRIVLTGGPGGGKTTAADLLRREFSNRVALVPETATMLFLGGFPRVAEPNAVRSAQTAIFHVQRNLEDVQAAQFPGQILLCDRGTVDGAAYWPEGNGDGGFFEAMGTSVAEELERYHHVIFFETAAVGGLSIASGNPARIESLQAAVELDKQLRALWGQHPRFHFIPHGPSFLAKITSALHTLTEILAEGRSNGRC
jgi:predicted ATPase